MARQRLIPDGDEFFTLRVKYPEHERIAALGRAEPKWLHTVALAHCNGHLTDGHIDPFRLKIILAVADLSRPMVWVGKLVEVGLWVELADGHYAIRDYLDYNPSAASVKALRESRREAGRLGGIAKAEASAVASASHLPQQTPSRVEVDLEVEKKEQDPKPTARMDQVLLVTAAWTANAPPLIQHRESYFANPKTIGVVDRKLRLYHAPDLIEAVACYATVLGGSEYRWDFSWTLVDFLNRGLDKFVPEARPLENFRIKETAGPNMKYGQRDVSSEELLALADRLDAERFADERRQLAPG